MAWIATRANGVVARRELLVAGITRAEIEHRLDTGLLIVEFRGVYRVGHRAPSVEARYLAAVKACGDGAVLCDRAAGFLLGVLKGAPPPPEVLTRTERRIAGIVTRRTRALDPRDVTTDRAIPTTIVPRTLADLAAHLSLDDLARACHEAGVRHRIPPAQVETVLQRRPNSNGAQKLQAVLHGDAPVTLSVLERRFLERCKQAGLPRPVTNRTAGTRRVDARWPAHRLTVELDSYRYHASRHAWEQDRCRDREVHARGDAIRRYTYADVVEDPRQMLAELRPLLTAPPRPSR